MFSIFLEEGREAVKGRGSREEEKEGEEWRREKGELPPLPAAAARGTGADWVTVFGNFSLLE